MPPMTITFCNQKGGTGKTTLSYLVAETLASVGKRVALRDEDPQGSSAEVVKSFQADNLTKVELWDQSRAGEYDFVIQDTLPVYQSPMLATLISISDRIIIPLAPSILDVRATIPSIGTVRANAPKNAVSYAIWNKVEAGRKISKELDRLEQALGLPALKSTVPNRASFNYAMMHGYGTLNAEDKNLLHQVILEFLS